jgi:hypothetical protein
MKKILHIFTKDIRHFWPEVAGSLLITAMFSWMYPAQWLPANLMVRRLGTTFIPYSSLSFLASTLTVLVPLSWWLLIARVIHAERLVGDNQFWLTRPYEWKELLAAKILFLAVFLVLPFVAAQCLLLIAAGFHPTSFLFGLLFNLLLTTGILIVPLVALAVVTSSFGRMTLTLLGVLIWVVCIAALSASFDNSNASSPYADRLSIPLVLCLGGSAIAIQYAVRRTWLARLLLLVLPLTITGIAFSVSGESLINQAYPRPAGKPDLSLQLSLIADSHDKPTAWDIANSKDVEVRLPFRISGVRDGYAVIPNVVTVSVEAPDGLHWTSPWQAIYNQQYVPESRETAIDFKMSRLQYDRFKSMPVNLLLSFAMTEAHASAVTRIPVPAGDLPIAVPGFGICTPQDAWGWSTGQLHGLNCRYALSPPSLTYIKVLWSDDPCSDATAEGNTGIFGTAWAGSLNNDPAEFGITSVWTSTISLSGGTRESGDEKTRRYQSRYLCWGSPILFTRYNFVRRTQFVVPLQGFRLPSLDSDSIYMFRG